MEEKIKDIISTWVGKKYGEQEMDNPSWNIKALAHEIAKHYHEFYWLMEMEHLKEDVEAYAKENRIELTEQQAYNIADRIQNSDWYGSRAEPEDMKYYINKELKRG